MLVDGHRSISGRGKAVFSPLSVYLQAMSPTNVQKSDTTQSLAVANKSTTEKSNEAATTRQQLFDT